MRRLAGIGGSGGTRPSRTVSPDRTRTYDPRLRRPDQDRQLTLEPRFCAGPSPARVCQRRPSPARWQFPVTAAGSVRLRATGEKRSHRSPGGSSPPGRRPRIAPASRSSAGGHTTTMKTGARRNHVPCVPVADERPYCQLERQRQMAPIPRIKRGDARSVPQVCRSKPFARDPTQTGTRFPQGGLAAPGVYASRIGPID